MMARVKEGEGERERGAEALNKINDPPKKIMCVSVWI